MLLPFNIWNSYNTNTNFPLFNWVKVLLWLQNTIEMCICSMWRETWCFYFLPLSVASVEDDGEALRWQSLIPHLISTYLCINIHLWTESSCTDTDKICIVSGLYNGKCTISIHGLFWPPSLLCHYLYFFVHSSYCCNKISFVCLNYINTSRKHCVPKTDLLQWWWL